MTPEEKARLEIDRQLEACGWVVQDRTAMNTFASAGVAVREFTLLTGEADYLLYAHGKAIGVVEAKPEGFTLGGVHEQAVKYTTGLPAGVPAYGRPLPFTYESTGAVTHFTNGLDPEPRSREVFTFHRPEELVRLAGLGAAQLRANLRQMPGLDTTRLWRVQVEAIHNLEKSLAQARPRSLIQMATGSGKTYTACSFCYRLIKFGKAQRILFLVDRNNLGKQTLNEFQQYASPYTGYKFTEEYNVQRLQRNTIEPASKVVITTIQRLYSMLKGEEEFAEENEEGSLFESASPLLKEALPVVYNPRIPPETFDFIVVDECHRSIYNVWRQVLEYFDAFIIGLTATPTLQTVGFFHNNVVQDYSHEKAVADGVNVGCLVYRIQTQITAGGATLEREPGYFVPRRDKRTGRKRLAELEEDLTYTPNQLDRDVVSEAQLRLVVRTFKERLFTEIFPGRTEVPKTLVFAKNDQHAEDIVRIMREEFGKGNDFCQKITSKTTGKKPEDVLNEFRNGYYPRIAVTVDMIATGTDMKPLECLLFMRNINSATYFDQMKGRGVRIIGPDDLQRVTPDARHKTHFVIVDAVGVCENDKGATKPLDRQPSVGLDKVLGAVAAGVVHADVVSTLAARLAALGREITLAQAGEIAAQAGGQSLETLAAALVESIDPDSNADLARQRFGLAAYEEPSDAQVEAVEQEQMAAALRPFHHPPLRKLILDIKAAAEQVIDQVTPDTLLLAGFDAAAREKAASTLESFREFLLAHRDEIEAIRILYSRPYRAGLRYRQVKELAAALERPPLSLSQPAERLWRLYQAVEPEQVQGQGGKALVDLVAIVRHALYPDQPLVPLAQTIQARYQDWLAEQARAGISFTPEQRRWLDAIADHIASSLSIDQEDLEEVPFNQMGGLGKVYQLFGARLPTIMAELNERLVA
ncbi:MAG: DEAD/DEAH box helicase [Chloroflexi bacterium]|nr:DEAD/DEAH box helicase [Chloroflexota bacterium]